MTIPELRGNIDLHGNPYIFFQPVLGHQCRMPGGAAGHQKDALDALELITVKVDFRQHDIAGLQVDPAAYRIGDRLWLFEDFLEHEMLEAGLFGHRRIPFDGGNVPLNSFPGFK